MDEIHHHEFFLKRAIELSSIGSGDGHGGPFGAVIVRDGKIIGEGYNQVTKLNDPSAHAEIVAIRAACKLLNSFQLTGCVIYTSCEPCPMCLGAIYWARPEKVYFAALKTDAADAGFDDAFIYEEMRLSPPDRFIPMIFLPLDQAKDVFNEWKANPNKISY
jgi:tRNA(Arg) A34 adenosine deaminase TadA